VNKRAKEEAETTNRIQDDANNGRVHPFPNGLPADRLMFITARLSASTGDEGTSGAPAP
jgi:hypothetical protein